MRINDENQKLEMEERDWNYIMPAYLRSYLFYTKNIPPAEVVFPMFKTVKFGEVTIPVRWVEPDSQEATEVAADASNIPEATEAEIAQKDAEEKPPIAEQVKEIAKELPTPAPEDLLRQQEEEAIRAKEADEETKIDSLGESVSAARAAFAAVEEPLTKAEEAEMQADKEADAARDAAIDEAEAEAKAKAEAEAIAEAEAAEEATSETVDPTTPPPPNVAISEATQPPSQPPQPTAQPTEPDTNAKPPAPKRQPKLPPVVIPPGQPLDGMHPRDRADQNRVAKDLIPEKDVDESVEIEQDVEGLKE